VATALRFVILCTLAAGCASPPVVVDGRPVPRMGLDFVGQPFAVRVSAAHPDPGGASSGLRAFGGRVSGNVCGIDVSYDVEHAADHTTLNGFIDNGRYESTIDVRDVGDVSRVISGALARGSAAVRLDVRVNHIRGVVGLRSFSLDRDGDDYVGALEYVSSARVGTRVHAAAVIHGADELWTLPPATQAAVLPALLTCYGDELEDQMRGKFVVGFGGRQTWESSHVSAIYHGGIANAMTAPSTTTPAFPARDKNRHDPLPTWELGGPQ